MIASQAKNRNLFLISMCIFGTIGILRRQIPLSSSLVALARGMIGSLFLLLVTLCSRQKLDWSAIGKQLPLLILSGGSIGFNWIALFEAFHYTSVATATLCYYLAPIIVILAAPVVLKESWKMKNVLCAVVALVGMILVSGVTEAGFSGHSERKGIALGLLAAVLYASVILMNKKISEVPAYDKTIFQLSMASAALLPYVLLTEDWTAVTISPTTAVLLLIVGIVHTGIAYWLYFRSIGKLPSHTVALLSYVDPVLAIFLSVILLKEPMGIASMIGSVLILGAAYFCEK